MDTQRIIDEFTRTFGSGLPPRLFRAPGRVNLIGEHTDYNGGYVFPCALSLGVCGAVRKRNDNIIKLVSGNVPPAVSLTVDDVAYQAAHGWANYPKAVLSVLLQKGYVLGGFELYVEGDLPTGAGLSSSACIELLTGVILNALYDLHIAPIDMVTLCQYAENTYIGVNCGIMDQFASGMGRKNHAILLNCATLAHTYVPLALGAYSLIIANTNKQRGLADSKYNERRAECAEALEDLCKAGEIPCLCALTPEAFEARKYLINNETPRKRAAHAVYENARTLAAVDALNRGELDVFGRLMNESHVSLRDLYEVTGIELDVLAEAAWAAEGVLGSRMTGAGFGGCTVSVVRTDAAERFIKTVGDAYTARTGLTADFYIAETGEGAGELS